LKVSDSVNIPPPLISFLISWATVMLTQR
jgi:hypothetical protein